jgi:putative transposase
MGRKRYTPEQIVHLLREAEVLLSQGRTVPKMCRELGFSSQTYYRWRRTYGGLDVNRARRLKELERENARLKRLAGEQALDIAILKEASRGNS